MEESPSQDYEANEPGTLEKDAGDTMPSHALQGQSLDGDDEYSDGKNEEQLNQDLPGDDQAQMPAPDMDDN